MGRKGLKIIEVEWEDAATVDGWHEADTEPGGSMCLTVGYLVAETKERISLAGSVGDDEACAVMTIPKGCVRKRRVIRR